MKLLMDNISISHNSDGDKWPFQVQSIYKHTQTHAHRYIERDTETEENNLIAE